MSTIVGGILGLAALIVAIVVIVKGRTGMGIIQIVSNVIGSPIFYFIGLSVYAAMGAAADNPR